MADIYKNKVVVFDDVTDVSRVFIPVNRGSLCVPELFNCSFIFGSLNLANAQW